MKKLLLTLKSHKYFLLFIFLFSYIQSVQIRFLVRQEFNWFLFTPEAAIARLFSSCLLFLIIHLLITKWQKSSTFKLTEMLKIFSISLLIFVLLSTFGSYCIAFAFNNIDRNFNTKTFFSNTSGTFIDALIYGSFYLAYYYFQQNKANQIQLNAYNAALAETKINQLKNQLNPHFLFNNLNVLDQLIEEDKHKASEFLTEFSDLYRYVLQATDKKITTIAEEINFAKKYFSLMKQKYGNAYNLVIENPVSEGKITPLTLQLLLENAIQHNLGTSEKPIEITISIKDTIEVSNNIIAKRNSKNTSGRALKNLKQQYLLLSNKPIEINQTATIFTVTLPIL